ncbi:MAG: hypothetical protein WCF97_10935 [Nitrososphaeraceae archaeon]
MVKNTYEVKALPNSIKFYLPRVEGYFEGKFEPIKYTRVEVHTTRINEKNIIEYANAVRVKLEQKSLALEFNNKLILVNETETTS